LCSIILKLAGDDVVLSSRRFVKPVSVREVPWFVMVALKFVPWFIDVGFGLTVTLPVTRSGAPDAATVAVGQLGCHVEPPIVTATETVYGVPGGLGVLKVCVTDAFGLEIPSSPVHA
jgi:hypothetical protein